MKRTTRQVHHGPIDAPGEGEILRRLDALGVHRPPDWTQQPPLTESLQAEFTEMLAYQSVDELRAIARTRDLELTGEGKTSLIQELARHLSDLQAIRFQIQHTDPVARAILAYLHLALTPGRGLSAENTIRELSEKLKYKHFGLADLRMPDERQPPSPSPVAQSIGIERMTGGDAESLRRTLRRIYSQLASLSRRGLLLPFRQNNATYYSVPAAVRVCLPPLVHLAPAYAERKSARLTVCSRPPRTIIHRLYEVWKSIAARDPACTDRRVPSAARRPARLVRSPSWPREPIEDQWPAFQAWNHVPAEIAKLTAQTRPRGYLDATLGTSSQTVTIPATAYRLRHEDLASLREETGCSSEEIEFYCSLLEKIGAISGKPGQPIVVRPERMHDFLSQPLPKQFQILYRIWNTDTEWNEMDLLLRTRNGVSQEKAGAPPESQSVLRLRRSLMYTDYKPEDLHHEWRAGRVAVLRFLSALPSDRWVGIGAFQEAVFRIDPNLLHTKSAPSVWWLESRTTRRQFGTTFDDWQQSYGQFVIATLEGPLAWLGAVSLGYGDEELEAFKITALGEFALGRTETPFAGIDPTAPDDERSDQEMPQGKPVCVFGDDLSITVEPSSMPSQLHKLLRHVGEIEEATPERFIYRLTADGIRYWLESQPMAELACQTDQGSIATLDDIAVRQAVDDLVGQLNDLCRAAGMHAAVPPVWREKLATWARNYGQLHLYAGLTLIELADDYVANELLASTSLRQHLVYQFSPRLIAIKSDSVDLLLQEMEKRGYTPRVE